VIAACTSRIEKTTSRIKLAVDDKDAFFVFELKRANSPDKAIGQVTRYMSWVQQSKAAGTVPPTALLFEAGVQ
jgi:hypothetical protein